MMCLVVELTCWCVCCTDEKRAVDSLFIVNWTGTLTEYILEPRVKSGLEKITDESPIEVLARAWAQWPLARSVSICCLLLFTVLHTMQSGISHDKNVCPSVICMNCDKMKETYAHIFIPYERLIILVFRLEMCMGQTFSAQPAISRTFCSLARCHLRPGPACSPATTAQTNSDCSKLCTKLGWSV